IALREFRAAASAQRSAVSLDAADYGVIAPVGSWDPTANLILPIGAVTGPTTTRLASGAQVTWFLQRLSTAEFWATGEAIFGAGLPAAHRTVSLALRLALPDIVGTATLTARDSVRVRAGAAVIGADSTPPWWAGAVPCPPSATRAGVAAADTT